MWQEPHLACPSHLCRMPSSAPRRAASRVVPSVTSMVFPDGSTVNVDICSFLAVVERSFSRVLVDRRARSVIDRSFLHRLDDERNLVLGEMGVERQRDRAIRHFFGDEIVAAAMAALEIMPLQMQWIAVGRGFHLLEPQILHDGVAAGTSEAGPKMDHIEKPVYLGHVGADVRWFDALEGLHI